MTVTSITEAWREAERIFPTDYIHDSGCSEAAGYDVYSSTSPEHFDCWISDLVDRLEVNVSGRSTNIWIVPEKPNVPGKIFSVFAVSGNGKVRFTLDTIEHVISWKQITDRLDTYCVRYGDWYVWLDENCYTWDVEIEEIEK